MREIKYIVLHCTATSQRATVESIQRYWREQLGWRSPGYHVLIEATGKAHELHPIEFMANGVRGYNAHSIHISYVGGVDSTGRAVDNRTAAQRLQMASYVRKFMAMFPQAEVLGHRDFPNVVKACPSFDVKKWMEDDINSNRTGADQAAP